LCDKILGFVSELSKYDIHQTGATFFYSNRLPTILKINKTNRYNKRLKIQLVVGPGVQIHYGWP
jgi:hypothetical protein